MKRFEHAILMKNYIGKKILITGGGGYIGSALVGKFCGIDCKLVVMHKVNKGLIEKNVEEYLHSSLNDTLVEIVCGDISQKKTWENIISPDIDIIFHLAAVEYSPDGNIMQDFNINAISVLRMLETCVEKSCNPKIVFSSSTNIFGDAGELIVDENTESRPLAEWSAHKLLAENYLKIFSDRLGMKTVTLRLPNVYGPVLRKNVMNRMVMNKVIQHGIKNRRLILFNNRNCYRDFLYIEDIVDAFMRAGLMSGCDCDGRYFVIGSKRLTTIAEVWTIISDEIGKIPISINDNDKLSPMEMRSFTGNYHKFNSATGWKPGVDLETGIRRTVEEVKKTFL